MNGDGWREVTRDRPCTVCNKPDWCAVGGNGLIRCERVREAPAGLVLVQPAGAGGLFRSVGNDGRQPARPRAAPTATAAPAMDWGGEAQRFREALTPDGLATLAAGLNVPTAALETLGVGWATEADLRRLHASGAGWRESYPDGAYSFPERDGGGRVIGLALRATDGRKGSPSGRLGAHRGLIVPATLRDRPDPVLVVEGASDGAALECLGLAAVGRPSNTGGAIDLAKLLKGRAVLVLGERDAKPDGSWPGRAGAERVAQRLASAWGEAVPWALPPEDVKDIRAWLQSRVAAGLDLGNGEACRAAGAERLAALKTSATEEYPEKTSQAERLVRLALELYRIGISEGDEAFAVPHDGPNLALMFRGSRDALRAALSREFRRRYSTTPNAGALADALTALAGEAHERTPEPVYLRLAEYDGGIVLDLGGADGRAVVIRPSSWELVYVSPVLFRRTALTGALPEPERGGDLAELRGLLNVTEDSWPLVVGWLVAALLPSIPHPVLMLGGEQGAGKSTAARLLVGLFDPSPALLRSQPKEPEAWALAAAGSWAVVVDNVTGMPAWFSDALCRAVTGDGWVRRRLYTDGELSVVSFRRVVVITSIDPGTLRGDLGDRLLVADLAPIGDGRRRAETELDETYAELRSKLLGALLDLAAAVFARLSSIGPAPCRMSDFGRVLTAVDAVLGGKALGLYLAQRDRIAGNVLEGDAIGASVVGLMAGREFWDGTARELLAELSSDRHSDEKTRRQPGWPKSARGLGSAIRRLAPALRAVGVGVTFWRQPGGRRSKIIQLERLAAEETPEVPEAQQAQQPHEPPEAGEFGTIGTEAGFLRPADSPAENGPGAIENAVRDRRDHRDHVSALSSIETPAIPPGWTAQSWAVNLRRMADRCEALRPDLAGDYRAQADALDAPPQAATPDPVPLLDPEDTSDADERAAIMSVEAEAEAAAATGGDAGA